MSMTGSVLLAIFSVTQCVTVDLWLRLLGRHGLVSLIPFLHEASLGKSPVLPHTLLGVVQKQAVKVSRAGDPFLPSGGKLAIPVAQCLMQNSLKTPRSSLDCLEM